MSAQPQINNEFIQGSQEWLNLRKTKITATDACVIMGSSHWKTKIQLYNEKISFSNSEFCNSAMKRGSILEPIARDLYCLKKGIDVHPKVIIKDWAMASVDGISECGKYLVEIKCPGDKDHQTAIQGKVPTHYYAQLQHQMYVCNLDKMDYFSFDGMDGIIIEVVRDTCYIEKMLDKEWEFYQCLENLTPPEPLEDDYIEKTDELWEQCCNKWKSISNKIKELEQEESELRKQLIFLSGESNAKGCGISLCQVTRKGNVDYGKIPELKNIDLEKYRKSSSTSWRITQS